MDMGYFVPMTMSSGALIPMGFDLGGIPTDWPVVHITDTGHVLVLSGVGFGTSNTVD